MILTPRILGQNVRSGHFGSFRGSNFVGCPNSEPISVSGYQLFHTDLFVGAGGCLCTFLEKKSLNYENLEMKVAISRKKMASKYAECFKLSIINYSVACKLTVQFPFPEVLSICSTIYFLISVPPSSLGGLQCTMQLSA